MLFRDITFIDENYTVQKNQNILCDGNKITYIGSTPPPDYTGEIYGGKNKVAVPGFFNLHCHVPMVLMRGYGEGLPLHRWLNEKIFPFEDLLTSEDVYWGAMLGMAEMLRSGAVSFTDMYMLLDGICSAVDTVGMKANLSHGATGFTPDTRFSQSNAFAGTAIIRDFVSSASHDRIIPEVSVHAEYTSHEKLVRDVAEFAAQNNLRVHIHVSETQLEHDGCKSRRDGRTPTEWFHYCGIFQNPTTAAHCVWIDNNDFQILAENNVTVAHCPSSNLKLGSGIAPIKKMLDSGIHVAVGTDGASSNNNLNLLEEINLASILGKGASLDPMALDTSTMFNMSCKTAAAAQGRPDCGAIKVGNRADIIVFDLDKPSMRPAFDIPANILYSAQADDICLNMVDGNILYKNGEFYTIDIEKALYHAEKIRETKLASL